MCDQNKTKAQKLKYSTDYVAVFVILKGILIFNQQLFYVALITKGVSEFNVCRVVVAAYVILENFT